MHTRTPQHLFAPRTLVLRDGEPAKNQLVSREAVKSESVSERERERFSHPQLCGHEKQEMRTSEQESLSIALALSLSFVAACGTADRRESLLLLRYFVLFLLSL